MSRQSVINTLSSISAQLESVADLVKDLREDPSRMYDIDLHECLDRIEAGIIDKADKVRELEDDLT